MRTRTEKTNGFKSRRVSIVEQARKTETKDYKLETVLKWIKDGKGKFADNVREVRRAIKDGDKDKASEAKLNLPACMFSGTFTKRSSKDIKEHSGILCLDFDHLDNPQKAVDEIRYDPHIIAGFISPSGTGCKILIAIPKDTENHREAFVSASAYIKTMYNLDADESGKDVSRLCFLSYDPQLHFADDAVELPITMPLVPEPIKKNEGGTRVGDKYNEASDARDRSATLLRKLGWQIGRGDAEKTYCTRPNKERGISGTLWSNGSFYCFSDNASPLDASASYSPFALYTIVEHNGNFKESCKDLASQGFGDAPNVSGLDRYGKAPRGHSNESEEQIQEVASSLPIWTQASDIPEDLNKRINMRYPILIDGLVHRGTKVILGGGSKSYKTWTLLNLAISVATGEKWFGRDVVQTDLDVIFINFEVAHEFFLDRVRTVCKSMNVVPPENLKIWSLRGVCNDLSLILKALDERLDKGVSLIVIDPIYKGLAGRDENSAGDMGQLMNEVEAIVEKTGACVAFAAHYSKGNQADKDPLDRVSGSGVFARDPDTIMGLTAHEEDNCFSVHSALRNFAGIEPFVVEWNFPLFKIREDLDASKLRKPNQKVTGSQVFNLVEEHMPQGIKKSDLVVEARDKLSIGRSTVYAQVKSLILNGKLVETAGNLFTK
jgi:hypothetical protein